MTNSADPDQLASSYPRLAGLGLNLQTFYSILILPKFCLEHSGMADIVEPDLDLHYLHMPFCQKFWAQLFKALLA